MSFGIVNDIALLRLNTYSLRLSSELPFNVPNTALQIPFEIHTTSLPGQIRSPRESYHKQCTISNSGLKSKELDSKRTSADKIASEIVGKGQPYKEIEAVINDNRVIIRMHKEPVKEEYDPQCECVGQDTSAKEAESSLRKCDNGISFEMDNGSLELCRAPREDVSSVEKSSFERETGCRTITLYPQADEDRKPRVENPIELEENPNIFVLRIRKRCESADKHKIDFEFRVPQPWRSQKK